MNHQLIKPKEACQKLGIGRTNLQDLLNKGKIGHVRIGRKVFFTDEQLEAFIKESSVKPFDAEKAAMRALG